MNSVLAVVCPDVEWQVLLMHPSTNCWFFLSLVGIAIPAAPGWQEAGLSPDPDDGDGLDHFPALEVAQGAGHWCGHTVPFLWQSSFMMDQINSGTLSSIFYPSSWKASVFCPKSQVFLRVDVLRDGSTRFVVGTCCSFLATKSYFLLQKVCLWLSLGIVCAF